MAGNFDFAKLLMSDAANPVMLSSDKSAYIGNDGRIYVVSNETN